MNGDDFVLASDGWSQITPCGEFPHAGAGVVQVIDRAACDAIAADFNARKADANFPGILVDFDHFSLDTGQSSEAAGWISELESRDTGLWARVRWSDAGLAAVQGGRFRLMSPVFPPPSACEDLGGGRIRPRTLVSVALTNEPNIKGGRPLANRQLEVMGAGTGDISRRDAKTQRLETIVANRDGEQKLKWVLGNPPSGEHCGVCLARAGQVKTAREWAAMKAPPCNCHCTLEPVDEKAKNRWSDVARAASLAVRRTKAAKRSALLREFESSKVEKARTGGVSRGDAETQRRKAAREAVLRELVERRKKLTTLK